MRTSGSGRILLIKPKPLIECKRRPSAIERRKSTGSFLPRVSFCHRSSTSSPFPLLPFYPCRSSSPFLTKQQMSLLSKVQAPTPFRLCPCMVQKSIFNRHLQFDHWLEKAISLSCASPFRFAYNYPPSPTNSFGLTQLSPLSRSLAL